MGGLTQSLSHQESVDSTQTLGVIVSSPFADYIQVRALDFGDSSKTGPVLNNGIPGG